METHPAYGCEMTNEALQFRPDAARENPGCLDGTEQDKLSGLVQKIVSNVERGDNAQEA